MEEGDKEEEDGERGGRRRRRRLIVYTWYFGTISGAYCIPMLVFKQVRRK